MSETVPTHRPLESLTSQRARQEMLRHTTEATGRPARDAADVARDGFAVIPQVVGPGVVELVVSALEAVRPGEARRERDGRVYAVRNLRSLPQVRDLADAPALRAWVEPVLGPGARVVRALLFDKTPGANWKVAWHQDRSVAVKRRLDVPGFGPWSLKAGVVHVQPPVAVLENMLTVRLSLDDCGPDNGPLRVMPGSHAAGVLSPDKTAEWLRRREPVCCLAPAGGAVLMRPLLLHASSPARSPGHRRVVHLEYAAGELPGGLEWNEE